MEGTNGARLATIAWTPMRPHNYSRFNVLQRGQRVQAASGNSNKCQKIVTENHGVASSILALGTNIGLGALPPAPLLAHSHDSPLAKTSPASRAPVARLASLRSLVRRQG